MKTFHQKWQECLAHARGTPPPLSSPPPGFAASVVARHFQTRRETWEGAWLRLGIRTLTASAVLLLLTALAYWKSAFPPDTGLRPPLENAIIEQLHLL